MRSTLRPHQEKAITLLKHSILAGNKRPLIQAPTGFGKTLLAAAIVEGALKKGNRVTFVVPALSLIDQTVERFQAEGITEIGVIQAKHEMTDWSKPVQIASVQTLDRRKWPKSDIVVVDEAHRWFKLYERWMQDEAWQKVPFVGLSATPWTKGLGKFYDDLIIASTTKELIKLGYLSEFRVFAPSHPDLSGVKTVAGDYHEGELSGAMQEGTLTADIVTTWLEKGEGRSTLCFAVDRAHARNIQKQFDKAGVLTAYIDAFTDIQERSEIERKFHRGDVQVVCNVGCLTTGIDWDVRCIILARPTKSEMLFVQIIGRGLRTANGKKDCIILDHSDTHSRLGFVTDIHHEKLSMGQRSEKEQQPRDKLQPLPKECPSCSYLRPAKVQVCPSCGFKPEKQSEIECIEGELVELDEKGKRKSNKDTTWDDKILFIRQLRGYALEKGHKDGWVAHKYKSKFGVWPNDPRVSNATPMLCCKEVRSWIISQNIRYVKSKEKRSAV